MARIGKLERWILVHAYLKTVNHKVPSTWTYPRRYEPEGRKYHKQTKYHNDVLYKSEVLLNYFSKLHLSHKLSWFDENEKFYTDKNYKSALATYTRTVKAMEAKGYIEVWTNVGENWTGVHLTYLGKRTAERFLNVNSGP